MAGVTPTGFEVRRLDELIAETNAAMIAAFGPGFDTSLDTPQGQAIAVLSDAQSLMWESMQGVYASFDIAQATGARLDQLGQFRQTPRKVDETDNVYRTRLLAPSNPTETAINRLVAAVSAVAGVTSVQVNYNGTGLTDNLTNLGPLSAAIVVEGGADIDVATAIADNAVFGLGLNGNTAINIESGIRCNTIKFIRPELVTINLEITTDINNSVGVCRGTSVENVRALMLDAFNDVYNRPGMLISVRYLESLLTANGIGVGEVTLQGNTTDLQLAPFELATLDTQNVVVNIGG